MASLEAQLRALERRQARAAAREEQRLEREAARERERERTRRARAAAADERLRAKLRADFAKIDESHDETVRAVNRSVREDLARADRALRRELADPVRHRAGRAGALARSDYRALVAAKRCPVRMAGPRGERRTLRCPVGELRAVTPEALAHLMRHGLGPLRRRTCRDHLALLERRADELARERAD